MPTLRTRRRPRWKTSVKMTNSMSCMRASREPKRLLMRTPIWTAPTSCGAKALRTSPMAWGSSLPSASMTPTTTREEDTLVHRERTIDSASLRASPLPRRAWGGRRRTTSTRSSPAWAATWAVSSSEPSSMTMMRRPGSGIEVSRRTLAPMTAASLRQGMRMTTSSGASGCEGPPCRGAPREAMSMKKV